MKTVNKLRNVMLTFCLGLCVACGNQQSEQQETSTQELSSNDTDEPATPPVSVPSTSKGVGPISNYQPEAISEAKVKEGEELFTTKCSMCHRLDSKLVGPALKGVTKRRTPEWVLNMMLDPDKMIAEDADAKALLEQYGSPMINLQLTEDNAKAIYDYLRKADSE